MRVRVFQITYGRILSAPCVNRRVINYTRIYIYEFNVTYIIIVRMISKRIVQYETTIYIHRIGISIISPSIAASHLLIYSRVCPGKLFQIHRHRVYNVIGVREKYTRILR